MDTMNKENPVPAAQCKHCATGTEVPSTQHLPVCPNYRTPELVFPERCPECGAVSPKVGDHHDQLCPNYLPF